jgi:hypothetical protein
MFLRHRLGDAKASRRWILLGVGLALPEGLGDTKASRRWILLGVEKAVWHPIQPIRRHFGVCSRPLDAKAGKADDIPTGRSP